MRSELVVFALAACDSDEPCDPTQGACTFSKDVNTMTVPAGLTS